MNELTHLDMNPEQTADLTEQIFLLLRKYHENHGMSAAESIGILTFVSHKLMAWVEAPKPPSIPGSQRKSSA